MQNLRSIAIVGSGPAALMTADVVSSAGHSVSIFEKRKAPGRKLLIAGSSGLNITNNLPLAEFMKHYSGPSEFWHKVLKTFSPEAWIKFIENLKINTFEGTSGRYFVQDMKASKFLRAWLNQLSEKGVQFYYDHECVGFEKEKTTDKLLIHFSQKNLRPFDALCFCLGGGSYEPAESPLRWPSIFLKNKLGFDGFTPSNVGYQIDWTEAFLKEAEGLPLKNIKLTSSKGSRMGDAVITKYGLEGTPVYFVGEPGTLKIDLKPDLNREQILIKCQGIKENLSPLRRVKRQLSLCPASLALLFHHTPKAVLLDLKLLASFIKSFPITFRSSQSIDEAISSAGGLHLSELNENFMLKKYPGVFAAGEMLNWDAPTGGFLIQGCVSQGFCAGQGVISYFK